MPAANNELCKIAAEKLHLSCKTIINGKAKVKLHIFKFRYFTKLRSVGSNYKLYAKTTINYSNRSNFDGL